MTHRLLGFNKEAEELGVCCGSSRLVGILLRGVRDTLRRTYVGLFLLRYLVLGWSSGSSNPVLTSAALCSASRYLKEMCWNVDGREN